MMKTEKELKDELEDIFFDALTDKSNPPYYTDKVDPENDGYWQCKVYELCADELIKRGYGDVSEYKAEIERLRESIEVFKNDTECNLNHITVENGQLKAKNKVLKDGIAKAFINGFNEGRKQVEKDIRRAKIDVLKELKTRHDYAIKNMGYPWDISQQIDKLIKEVENKQKD